MHILPNNVKLTMNGNCKYILYVDAANLALEK